MAEAWSRNSTAGGSGGANNQPSTITTNTTQTGTKDETSTTTGNKNESYSKQNMSNASLAALEALIAQMLGGGTQTQANETAQRLAEINNVRNSRDAYSKSAAFADAQGAMAQAMRRALESTLPNITRAAEGAGTSQNSMRALMLQDATNRAAESSSSLGLQAAVNYGNIGASLSNILEALTRPQDTVTKDLLAALGIAKGATESGTSTMDTTSTTNSSANTTSNTSEVKGIDYTNLNSMVGPTSSSSPFQSFGPVETPSSYSNLSNSAWSNLVNSNGGSVESLINAIQNSEAGRFKF